jgi:hypothetical protein
MYPTTALRDVSDRGRARVALERFGERADTRGPVQSTKE